MKNDDTIALRVMFFTMCKLSLLDRVQLTVMFVDGVTRLEKMKKTEHLRVCM